MGRAPVWIVCRLGVIISGAVCSLRRAVEHGALTPFSLIMLRDLATRMWLRGDRNELQALSDQRRTVGCKVDSFSPAIALLSTSFGTSRWQGIELTQPVDFPDRRDWHDYASSGFRCWNEFASRSRGFFGLGRRLQCIFAVLALTAVERTFGGAAHAVERSELPGGGCVRVAAYLASFRLPALSGLLGRRCVAVRGSVAAQLVVAAYGVDRR